MDYSSCPEEASGEEGLVTVGSPILGLTHGKVLVSSLHCYGIVKACGPALFAAGFRSATTYRNRHVV